MKNKKFIAKTFLTLAMSVSMVAAGVTLAANKTVSAADGVAVSNDIQAIIDGINNNGGGSFNAEYVKDHTIDNAGATVSGIRVNITTDSDCMMPLSGYFDINGLTYEDSLIGLVFDNGFTASPDLYVGMGDRNGDITYLHYNHMSKDAAGTPRGRLSVRQYTKSGNSWEVDRNIYTDDHGFGLNQDPYPLCLYSRFGYTATPFNVYYDNSANMLLADKVLGDTETSKVAKILNVQPNAYSAYTDPFTGNNLTDSTVSGLKTVEGFSYNSINLRLRSISGKGKAFILTGLAGLDLTDQNAAYTAENASLQLKNYEAQLGVNSFITGIQNALPEAQIASRITNAHVADFTGTINVYKGRRSSVAAEYGSYGYAHASAEAELGAAIATVTDGKYAFAEVGDYTLEYVQGDKKLYVDVTATENTEKPVVFSGTNATVDKQTAKIGDVVTVTPATGYTLFNFGAEAPSVRVIVGSVKKVITLDENNAFTVTGDMFDGDGLKLEAAAYSKTYALTLFTKPAGEGDDSVTYTLYEGVPSTMYDGAYDGSGYTGLVTLSGFKFTYNYVGKRNAWSMNIATDLGNYGYSVTTLAEDSSAVQTRVYKTGSAADNAFAVTGNLIIRPLRITVSAVENSAKAYFKNGNINVSTEYKIPVAQWDSFMSAVGDQTGQLDVQGLFENGAAATDRPFKHATATTVKFTIDLTKVTARDIDGTNYYIVRLECANLKIENVGKKYYFGMYMLFTCNNGGQVLESGSDGKYLWTEVDMKAQIGALYNKYIKAEAPEGHHTAVTVNGTNYYSYISKASTEKLVEYYLASQGA